MSTVVRICMTARGNSIWQMSLSIFNKVQTINLKLLYISSYQKKGRLWRVHGKTKISVEKRFFRLTDRYSFFFFFFFFLASRLRSDCDDITTTTETGSVVLSLAFSF
jgi:hypothetical protein